MRDKRAEPAEPWAPASKAQIDVAFRAAPADLYPEATFVVQVWFSLRGARKTVPVGGTPVSVVVPSCASLHGSAASTSVSFR